MAEHGVEGYNNSGVSTQLIGDFIEVPHEKPWRYQEGDLTVTRGSAWSGPGCHDGCGVLLYTDKDGKWIGYTKLDSFVRAGRVRRSPWRTQSTPGISPTSSSGR